VPPKTTSCARNGGVCARLTGGDWAAACPTGHVPQKSGGEQCNQLQGYVCCVPEEKTECGLAGGVCSPYTGGDWYTACGPDRIPRGADDRIEDKGASCNGDPKLVCCVPRTATACENQGGTCRLHGGADPADACGLDEIPNGGGWGTGCNGDAAFVCCVKL
jgi:hypothetical protein